MSDADAPPGELIKRVQAGDPAAAQAVFDRFATRLIALARTRLDTRIRQKVDAEDVVQSVFRSFFTRSAQGEFEFANWEGVWGLLVMLTVRKCGRRANFFRAARRDVRLETPAQQTEASIRWCEGLADDPTPDEAAELADTTAELFKRLGSERERLILELSLQGYSVVEISQRTGHYERGVERVRQRIRTIMNDMIHST